MNEDLVLAITMLIILAVVVLFIQISQQIKVKRIQKMKIQRRFGEILDMEEVLPIERISVYHKHQGREDVDQVTWSDLSMDQVFQRIDQCDSAAGEAVLYNMLHCTDNGQAQWKELLKYYEEQAEPRKKAEAILISLGKREGLYYLPEYVDTLQASHVGSVFFYRLLQILLLGSVVGGLWNVQILPLAGVMAIVNIAVYIMTRMKYEQQMSMMELIVLVIDTGKTQYALQLAKEFAKKGNTLYLNLEAYAGRQEVEEETGGLTEILYYLRQGCKNMGIRLETLVKHEEAVDYLVPIEMYQDLKSVTEEEWKQLLTEIAEKSIYETVVLDIGDAIRGTYGILELCSCIYTPIVQEETAQRKLEQYRHNLTAMGLDCVLERTIFVEVRELL